MVYTCNLFTIYTHMHTYKLYALIYTQRFYTIYLHYTSIYTLYTSYTYAIRPRYGGPPSDPGGDRAHRQGPVLRVEADSAVCKLYTVGVVYVYCVYVYVMYMWVYMSVSINVYVGIY